MRSKLAGNMISNVVAQGWTAIMGLAFVPVYIQLLGIESYGLIGFFASLHTLFTLLDLGLSRTLARETARFRGGSQSSESILDLLRSMECVYFVIATIMAGSVMAAAPWIANHWLKADSLPVETVTTALTIMGLVTALKWYSTLYRSALLGLQEQVCLNASSMGFATARGVGTFFVLSLISASISAFFITHAILAVLETIVLSLMVHHFIPRGTRPPRFCADALLSISKYAAGLTAITFLSLLLTQVDKILLSNLLSLEDFGSYSFATLVAGSLTIGIGSASVAIGPRLTELVATGNAAAVRSAYHRYCQLITIMTVPPAIVLSFFSEHFLLLWTQDPGITAYAAPLVSILAIGTMFNGLMHTPYLLQLAYGWTRFAIAINIVGVLIIVPCIYFLTPEYGAIAAAWSWTALNAGYVAIGLPFLHRTLLPNELRSWWLEDVLPPALASLTAVTFVWIASPTPLITSPASSFIALFGAALLAMISAAFATPLFRKLIIEFFYRLNAIKTEPQSS